MRRYAKARQRRPGQMNKLEQGWADVLHQQHAAEKIAGWYYERVTLKLADDTRFTPDFFVVLADGAIELQEVKGGLFRDDAKVKLKVAATMFPWFTFKLVTRKGGVWSVKEIQPAD